MIPFENEPRGIGGWLLFYIIWTAFSIIAAITLSLADALSIPAELAPIAHIVWSIDIATCLWYILYAWLLVKFARTLPGSLPPIKFMLIATPVFNALTPLATALWISMEFTGADFGAILRDAYGPRAAGSIVGAFIIAFIWLAYFKKSVRVRNTFAD